MLVIEFTILFYMISSNNFAGAFECREQESMTACETPKCCKSGQLSKDICSGCPICASGVNGVCGAESEGYQPSCAKELTCFTSCDPCTSNSPNDSTARSKCIFPFLYKGQSYEKCTSDFSENGKPWCAINIQPLTEVPEDGFHWGDCSENCPGAGSECTSEQLFNKRGICVPKIQELVRNSRRFPHSFRAGDNDTTPIVKCSDLTAYVSGIDVVNQDVRGAPEGYLDEDVNKGFGGKYVYIKPVFTDDILLGSSGFKLIISENENNNPIAKDLSIGAGDLGAGRFRYIVPRFNDSDRKITEIKLVEDLNNDFNSCTQDINKGRGGRELYLCWRY